MESENMEIIKLDMIKDMKYMIEYMIGAEEAAEDYSDIYTACGIGASCEDDEISAEEEGFMHGYLEHSRYTTF